MNALRLLKLRPSMFAALTGVLALSLPNCGDPPVPDEGSIRINTEKACRTNPNYTGVDVYAYKIEEQNQDPILEIGGHPDLTNQDFSVDITSGSSDFAAGSFPVVRQGQKYAWLVYRPTNSPDMEYVSIEEAGKEINLSRIEFSGDGETVVNVELSFSQIKMEHNGDTICVTGSIKKGY